MDHFLPWVGENYNSQQKKIMILGESHYWDDEFWDGETKFVVEDYLKKKELRFFTSLTKICLDKTKLTREEKNDFWHSVLFYNYIPENLGKQGDRPSKEQFQKGFEPFKKILNEYKPNYILVCGKQLWDNIPPEFGEEEGQKYYFWWFPIEGGKKAMAACIYHPSRYPKGYGNMNPREIFKKLLSY
jgi:hypothetical protein